MAAASSMDRLHALGKKLGPAHRLAIFTAAALAGSSGLAAERWRRLRLGVPGEFSARDRQVPNYHHVWFAHELFFVNNRDQSAGVCTFGSDYNKTHGDWSVLCHYDSDGDGLTNGEELGDPCCTWRATGRQRFELGAQREYRRWHLTHPCRENFLDLVNASQTRTKPPDWPSRVAEYREKFSPRDCSAYGAAAADEEFQRFFFGGLDKGFEDVPWNPAKLLCLAVYVWVLAGWIWREQLLRDAAPMFFPKAALSVKASLLVNAAAFLYMDVTSGIVHLILDYAPHWIPGLGGLARGFQYHHFDPTAIIRISWYAYVSHIHLLVPVVLYVVHISEASRLQRLFWFWGSLYAHLFQTTHRWAHMPHDMLPWIVRFMQDVGILLSHERHMQHHADLERQFTILTGVSDVLLDALSDLLPAARYDVWMLLGVLWFVLPSALDVRFRTALRRVGAVSPVEDAVLPKYKD